MNLKNRKGFALPAVALLALAFLVVFVVLPAQFGSITSGSTVYAQLDSNGQFGTPETWLWAQVQGVDYGSVLRFNVKSASDSFKLANGSSLVPKATFDLRLSPKNATCAYAIGSVGQSQGVSYYNLGLARKELSYGVEPIKNGVSLGERLINGANVDALGKLVTFSDPDGNGKLVLENIGYVEGAYYCPPSNGVALLNWNNKPRVVDLSEYVNAVVQKQLYEATCSFNPSSFTCVQMKPAYDAAVAYLLDPRVPQSWRTGRESNYVQYWDSSKANFFLNVPNSGEFGKNNFIVRGNAAFFDSIVVGVAQPAKPVILGASVPTINEGQEGTASVTVRNDGLKGTIDVGMESNYFGGAGSKQILLEKGASAVVSFTVRAVGVTGDTAASSAFRACASNMLGVQNCDSRTVSSVIKETGQVFPTVQPPIVTPSPSVGAGAVGACLPFLQRSVSVPVGGFNLLFWNIGGTQVAKCEWDYVGIAFLLVLALVGYLLVSGKIEPMDLLSPSAIVAVVAGAVAYFLITAALGSFANLNLIFAFGAGLLGFVYSKKGGF